jgi:zinc transport system substrate-binding protein
VRNAAVVTVVVVLVVAGAYLAVSSLHPSQRTGLKVLTTFYPIYDFASNVAGTKANVSLLVPMTVDVHSFDPTPSSVAAVAQADLLVFNGAGLEPWIPSIVAAAENPNLVTVDSSEGIATIPVPAEFQTQANQTVDPHIWMDPVLAKAQVANILHGLVQADPADAEYFTANAQAYDAKLDLLNADALNLSATPATRDFVTFHEAFGYFAREYGLTQIPIGGPYEEDPTPAEIQGVVDAVHANHLCYVGYESLENPALSQAIAGETNATLISLDPIEGLTSADQALGATYVLKMQEDLNNLRLALNHVGCS